MRTFGAGSNRVSSRSFALMNLSCAVLRRTRQCGDSCCEIEASLRRARGNGCAESVTAGLHIKGGGRGDPLQMT